MQMANSRGARIFIKSLFSVYRLSQKNNPLFAKYFLGDYELKIIEILHSRGRQCCSYQGLHLKKI